MSFQYMVQTMSAFDAQHLVNSRPAVEFQLAKLMHPREGHEFDIHVESPEPGEPASPVIEVAVLTPSHMFVEFHFQNNPVYVSCPAMSTVTIGWLEKRND